jgi:hypothetical protein
VLAHKTRRKPIAAYALASLSSASPDTRSSTGRSSERSVVSRTRRVGVTFQAFFLGEREKSRCTLLTSVERSLSALRLSFSLRL